MRLYRIYLGYTLKCDVNRDTIWNKIKRTTNINKLITKVEIEYEPYLYNVTLYFDKLSNLVAAKSEIEKEGTFQIHKIDVPATNEYKIFMKKENDIYDKLHKPPVIPYKICE